jgi:His-Xaa-Ser system radical SAM maturase HxsB
MGDVSGQSSKAVDLMFRTPAPAIKVEFQGGEPLLNFDLVRHVVGRVEARNAAANKRVAFVIASNLYALTDEHLAFCKAHGVALSTSLDGPRDLHNANRPHPGRDSHGRAVAAIARARAALGPAAVAALMTTTKASLPRVREIIDEYVAQGFTSVFLRPVSPYGFAVRAGVDRDYAPDDWLRFYFDGLDHVVALNRRGVPFREEYAAIVLRKVLTPYGTGYVDLQSPAGLGLGVLAFNYDGDVYASDEARMLAEAGDRTFRLGRLGVDGYEDVMTSDALLGPVRASMSECVPMCADCGFQPYCGADPVQHHAVQGDAVGFKPTSGFCRRNMGVIRGLLRRLEDDPYAARLFRSWAGARC